MPKAPKFSPILKNKADDDPSFQIGGSFFHNLSSVLFHYFSLFFIQLPPTLFHYFPYFHLFTFYSLLLFISFPSPLSHYSSLYSSIVSSVFIISQVFFFLSLLNYFSFRFPPSPPFLFSYDPRTTRVIDSLIYFLRCFHYFNFSTFFMILSTFPSSVFVPFSF